jgi:hypothetical protein
MRWDFSTLCVLSWWHSFGDLGLKKEFVIFRLSNTIRFIRDVPFLFLVLIPKAPIVSLKCCLLFALVPTIAFMSCPRIFFVSGVNWVNIELSVTLKILYSLFLTGW